MNETMTADPRARQDGRRRLRELARIGPVFRGIDVMRMFEWEKDVAAQYLWRWRKQELIMGLGGRSDVFFNLEHDRDWHKHLATAVLLAMPLANETGVAVLNAGGQVTQNVDRRHFIVPVRENCYQIDHAVVEQRSPGWFARLQAAGGIPYQGGLAPLSPGAALADMVRFSPHRLDPDDIDFGYLEADETRRFLALSDADEDASPQDVYVKWFTDSQPVPAPAARRRGLRP
jgi:hypothetical protein